MFETLELQYLNKLSESKVRDFASPEAFHARKVQRLSDNPIKPSAQVSGEFRVPISALVADMSVESRQLIDGTPPVVRAFDFMADGFIEFSELIQGLFQELWRLYLLSRVQREKRVFHAEVCTHTFTRSRQHFFGGIICHDIKPIRANTVAKDLEIPDVSIPLAMLVKREPTLIKFVELFRYRIPLPKRNTDTSFFKFVARLELHRTVASLAFELRLARASDVEKAFPSDVQSDNHSVKGIAGYPCPVLLCALEQLRQVRLQAIATGIFTINAIVAILQLQEVIMHIAKLIQHVAQTFIFRVFAYLIFIGSQRFYQLPVFNPYTVGRQTRNLAITLCMSANWSKEYNIFGIICQEKKGRAFPSTLKHGGPCPKK